MARLRLLSPAGRARYALVMWRRRYKVAYRYQDLGDYPIWEQREDQREFRR